jgi:hypothetical protein
MPIMVPDCCEGIPLQAICGGVRKANAAPFPILIFCGARRRLPCSRALERSRRGRGTPCPLDPRRPRRLAPPRLAAQSSVRTSAGAPMSCARCLRLAPEGPGGPTAYSPLRIFSTEVTGVGDRANSRFRPPRLRPRPNSAAAAPTIPGALVRLNIGILSRFCKNCRKVEPGGSLQRLSTTMVHALSAIMNHENMSTVFEPISAMKRRRDERDIPPP